jgi:hypothetical protein
MTMATKDHDHDTYCRHCGDFIPVSRIESYYCSRQCEDRAEDEMLHLAQLDYYARVEG